MRLMISPSLLEFDWWKEGDVYTFHLPVSDLNREECPLCHSYTCSCGKLIGTLCKIVVDGQEWIKLVVPPFEDQTTNLVIRRRTG